MADILIDNQSVPSTPAGGKSVVFVDSTTKKLGQLDDGGTLRGLLSKNVSTASQGPGFAADTYLTNSNLLIPSCGIQAGMVFRWTISVSKTAAGVAAAAFIARLGTGLSTADAALLTLTSATIQTAAASSGLIIVSLVVRSSGAAGVVAGGVGVASNTAGLGGGIDGVSGSVDLSAAAGKSIGLSINGGASAAWTVTSCSCELLN